MPLPFSFSFQWIIRIILFVYFIIILSHISYADEIAYNFDIPTTKRRYFLIDETTGIPKFTKGKAIIRKSDQYSTNTSFSSTDTAFFVIDPWDNMPSDFLNKYFGKITNQYILPLIRKANHYNFKTFIFTNSCKNLSYSCSIPKSFNDLLNSKNIKLFFWQEIPSSLDLANNLRQMGIKKIIYTGFASNCCILFRSAGMIDMQKQGFQIYFVPKASAAVETTETWVTGEVHKFTSTVIAQNLGSLIEYKDIFQKLNSISSCTP